MRPLKKSVLAIAAAFVSFSAAHAVVVPAAGQIEVAFSPNEGGQALVVKVINSASREIRLLAYSFTSAPVTQALIAAKKRGVDVQVVVDDQHNLAAESKARAALSAMANAGITVSTIRAYPIHHDKVVIVDKSHVQTGSFNYSQAAEKSNSENVIVNWANPALAQQYLLHFARNQMQAVRFAPR